MSDDAPLLEVRELTKYFPVRAGVLMRKVGDVHAVDGVSLTLRRGQTLGLVGESGCGKTTVGRTILNLLPPSGGKVLFEGRDLSTLSASEWRSLRRQMQIVFQDPMESLNARHTVGRMLSEPFVIHKLGDAAWRRVWVGELLERVGLPPSAADRFPHEFSGGQRQRIGIARAIALKPKLIICDEAVSALDVSIRAQIINLLLEEIYRRAAHPYTRALISAIPIPDPTRRRSRIVLEGDVPSPISPPPGCRFHTRCSYATAVCKTDVPKWEPVSAEHHVACHHWHELPPQRQL
jgi:peptide/nickel transport system ATP-binding protein